MTQISLATSLHLNHGATALDRRPMGQLAMLEFVPVGLLCLKAYADQFDLGAEVRVTEVNGLINAGAIPNDAGFYEHVVDAVLRPHDDLVGLMTDADSLPHTVIIADRIKRRNPNVKISLGGPAASPLSRLVMERFPFVDYVVAGEGEETFVDLICCLQRKKDSAVVQGLTWRDGFKVVQNAPRPVTRVLDLLPVPAFDAYDMAGSAPLYLDVGRGCPFACRFCATAPFWKRQYRMKSIDRIWQELRLVRERYDRRQVNFSHDIFTCDRTWTLEFCDRLINEPIDIAWTCSTRTDIIDPEVLERMAAARCEEIYYGIETGSPRLQREIDKNLDLDYARRMVETTARVGIRPVTGFIVGYPMETQDTLRDTLNRYFEYLAVGGYRAHIFVLTPFAEAPMYRDYGPTRLDRFAEYYDLNLHADLVRLGDDLKTAHPDLFASAYRYAMPQLPAHLVDAAEELSASLSMLRALWPHILPWYGSPLEFYQRWVAWIEAFNEARRPTDTLPHQASASELLSFVEEEAERFCLTDESPIGDLIRYERLKLDAGALDWVGGVGSTGDEVDGTTVVRRQPHCIVSQFTRDIDALLRTAPGLTAIDNGRRCVAVVKVAPNLLNTISLDTETFQILEMAKRAQSVNELISSVCHKDDAAATEEFESYLTTIRELVNVGLLTVADAKRETRVPVTTAMA